MKMKILAPVFAMAMVAGCSDEPANQASTAQENTHTTNQVTREPTPVTTPAPEKNIEAPTDTFKIDVNDPRIYAFPYSNEIDLRCFYVTRRYVEMEREKGRYETVAAAVYYHLRTANQYGFHNLDDIYNSQANQFIEKYGQENQFSVVMSGVLACADIAYDLMNPEIK